MNIIRLPKGERAPAGALGSVYFLKTHRGAVTTRAQITAAMSRIYQHGTFGTLAEAEQVMFDWAREHGAIDLYVEDLD